VRRECGQFIQRVDASNRVADLKFPTGFGNVNDMSVLPNNPRTVVATVHTALVVYDDGVQRSNIVGPTEYNQPYFLALASPSNCYSTYPTGFRRIAIDTNGATLLTDTRDTVVTYPIGKLNMALAVSSPRADASSTRPLEPTSPTVLTAAWLPRMKPIGGSFYLTGGGSTWTFPR